MILATPQLRSSMASCCWPICSDLLTTNLSAYGTRLRANCSPYVNALQKQFAEVLPAYLSNDPQMSDPSRNQQWLKNLAWQISMG